MKHIWVDPPSGWKYGFPKVMKAGIDMNQWLIDEGYPKKEIESYGEHFFVRCWEATEEDIIAANTEK